MSLDPKSNREERETEKAKKAEDPPLDQPFPHRRQSFDPFFFSLEREPLPPAAPLTPGSGT